MKLFNRGRNRYASKSLGMRLKAAVAVFVTAGAVIVPQPAAAVTPGDVKDALQTAYDLYNKFAANQLTLTQATAQIIDAVNAAKTQILSHLDQLTAGEVRACARSAVIDLADITRFTPDTVQAFARDATGCATQAEAWIPVLSGGPLDEVGFALNTVGPIGLLARAYAGMTTPELKTTLVNANTNLVAKLKPSCIANWLWADATPQFVEVELICEAYNGHQGFDSVIQRRKPPLSPPLNFTTAIANAMVGTSYPVGLAALALIH